jgi:outer membrane protein assembly factor BamE
MHRHEAALSLPLRPLHRHSPRPPGPRAGVVALALAASLLGGCQSLDSAMPSWRSFGVYKLDINQGNFLSQDLVDKLKVGQTKQQVRLVLGTPLVTSAFRDNRWDYVYTFTRQGKVLEQRKLTVWFADEKLARWEGDEMPASAAVLNRESAARTAGESKWADTRSWWDTMIDTFGW